MSGDDSEKGNRFDREWRRNKKAGEALRASADGDNDDLRNLYSGEEELRRLAGESPPVRNRGWEPPTEQQFNDEWVTPQDALGVLRRGVDEGTKRQWVMGRLKGGMILAVGRSAQKNYEDPLGFVRVPARYWQMWDDWGTDGFWDLGDATFEEGGSAGYGSVLNTYRYYDVRFDPASFSGRPPAPPEVGSAEEFHALSRIADAGNAPAPPAPPPPEARTADLSRGDAQRFSRAIMAGWPESTRQFARSKALLFFPDKKVPRDWFYGIFSSIRGERKPGKQPKKRD